MWEVGDYVDARDLDSGAWFEGEIGSSYLKSLLLMELVQTLFQIGTVRYCRGLICL